MAELEALYEAQTWEQEVYNVVETQVKGMEAWTPQPKVLACEAEEEASEGMSTNAIARMHTDIRIHTRKRHQYLVPET